MSLEGIYLFVVFLKIAALMYDVAESFVHLSSSLKLLLSIRLYMVILVYMERSLHMRWLVLFFFLRPTHLYIYNCFLNWAYELYDN